MLNAYPGKREAGAPLTGCTWIDLVDPTDAEKAAFEQAFGLRVPAKEELQEIEATSRLRVERDALYMSAPLIFTDKDDVWRVVPAGFVLTRNVLMTLRFARLDAFDDMAAELAGGETFAPVEVFARLAEKLVDRLADRIEAAAADLDTASHVIFHDGEPTRGKPRPTRSRPRRTERLRRVMMRAGRTSERMSRVHYSLVCLDRMAKFATDRGHEWMDAKVVMRLHTICSDVASLVQFAEGLVSRVQLLQDAVTGLISIDQNEVMKVLTIVSVMGIPPVLVVGVYGMNFKHMPELDWPWGYPYALALVVVSALLPLIWFKLKDWI